MRPSPTLGRAPRAVVVVASKAWNRRWMRHCESALPAWQLPNDVVFVDAIPLTSTGKMEIKAVWANLQDAGYLS